MRRIVASLTLWFAVGISLTGIWMLRGEYLWILFTATGILIASVIGSSASRNLSWVRSVALVMLGYTYSVAYIWGNQGQFEQFYDKKVEVVGTVEDIPIKEIGQWKFTLRAHQVVTNGHATMLLDRVAVSVKDGPVFYGEALSLHGLLMRPEAKRNPGGYDDRAYLGRLNIHGRMKITDQANVERGNESEGNLVGKSIALLRQRLDEVVDKLFPSPEAALVKGLLLGWKTDVPEDWKEAFQQLGLTHLTAASGANVAIVTGTVFFIAKRFTVDKRVPTWIALAATWLFVGVSGAAPSAVRAGIMATMVLGATLLGRRNDFITAIAWAGLAQLIIRPTALWDIGFQLSFITAAGIALISPKITHLFYVFPRVVAMTVAVTLTAFIVTMPLSIYYFSTISLLSPLANLWATPLVAIFVPMGYLMLLIGLWSPLLVLPIAGILRELLALLAYPVKWLSVWGESFVVASRPPPVTSVLLFYGLLLLAVYRKDAVRWLEQHVNVRNPFLPAQRSGLKRWLLHIFTGAAIAIMVIPMLWLDRKLSITYIDVGQGDSIFIRTPKGSTALIDGGGIPAIDGKAATFHVGKRVVLPFLRYMGVNSLDMVILSHGDEDHLLGLIDILESVRVGALIVSGYPDERESYRRLIEVANRRGVPIKQAGLGDTWATADEVRWVFHHPDQLDDYHSKSETNAHSLVLELRYRELNFLFPGDIEGDVEAIFTPALHQTDVLKMAHHGSRFSTTDGFLRQVQPSVAVISVGERNRYGHPSKPIIDKLQKLGVQILRTDIDGAVTVRTDGYDLDIQTTVTHAMSYYPRE